MISAQFYQLRKQRVLPIAFAGLVLLMTAIAVLAAGIDSEEQKTASYLFAEGAFSSMTMFSFMFMAGAVGTVCCGDFPDKTINYELMSGSSRDQVYFGRAVAALVTAVPAGLFMELISLGLCALILGWGDSIGPGAAVLRVLMTVFPYIRICCFYIMVSFIVKNTGLVIITAFALLQGISLLIGDSSRAPDLSLALLCCRSFLRTESFITFELDGRERMVFDTSLSPGGAAAAVLVSLLAAAAYIFIGRTYFDKDDLR